MVKYETGTVWKRYRDRYRLYKRRNIQSEKENRDILSKRRRQTLIVKQKQTSTVRNREVDKGQIVKKKEIETDRKRKRTKEMAREMVRETDNEREGDRYKHIVNIW
jgi:hypothetical protein